MSISSKQREILQSALERIPFKWAGGPDSLEGMDCIGYASYIRGLLGKELIDMSLPELAGLYESYPEESDMPGDVPLILCDLLCPRLYEFKHLALIVISAPAGEVISTYLDFDSGYIALMGPKGSRVTRAGNIPSGQISGIFDPTFVLESQSDVGA